MAIAKSTTEKTCDYMRRIRNKAKKHYAFAYWQYKLGHSIEPQQPADLSYMAAQAVRMNINELLKG